MFVSSAASRIGTTPAITADTMPTIHVGRCGTRLRLVLANHPGSRPSRLIAYQTRDAPSMNENSTVRMPTIAPIATTSAKASSPIDWKALANPLSRSIRS